MKNDFIIIAALSLLATACNDNGNNARAEREQSFVNSLRPVEPIPVNDQKGLNLKKLNPQKPQDQ